MQDSSVKKQQCQSAQEAGIARLLDVMKRLRAPETGCPWDQEQDFQSIAPHTIEEAYEVVDAIERQDMTDLKDELGDLLFQVVYHAQMAAELNEFTFEDVVAGVTAKMIHRHPHVFGEQTAATTDEVNHLWEQRKDQESKRQQTESILDDVPRALPALKRAQKIQKRAARVGFEWPEAIMVLDKLEEELGEMREAMKGGRQDEIVDELGDLLFVITNLGRMLGIDCEMSLSQCSDKFSRRFGEIERGAKSQNKDIAALTLEEKEQYWQAAKRREKDGR